MTQLEYLEAYAEEMPSWLKGYKKGQPKPLAEFLGSRIVYYPGGETDWHPVEVFGGSRSAHCFVYADYWLPKDELLSKLYGTGIEGYEIFDEVPFSKAEMMSVIPPDYSRFLSAEELHQAVAGTCEMRTHNNPAPYAHLLILERKSGYGEENAPRRLAILYLGADGIATYAAMFANGAAPCFFGMLLQDHGFGGNYDRFGKGGLLERIMVRSRAEPDFILSETGEVYDGYEKVCDLERSGSRDRMLFRNCRRFDC